MGQALTHTLTIPDNHTDCFGFCMPGAVLDALHEVGNMHSLQIGYAVDQLPGAARWLLLKVFLRLERPVPRQSAVTISTWYRGNVGAQVYRDYDLHINGTHIGEAVTAWVLFDWERQRPLRPDIINDPALMYTPPQPKTLVLGKLTPPETMREAGTRPVRYSDLDMNGHMNNIKYLDIVCDTLRLEESPGRFLRSVTVQYISQTRPGETLFLERGEHPDGQLFVTGRNGAGERKFSAAVELATLSPTESG